MAARVLLIDNYDSFVFNLARYLEELGVETEVQRNDAISIEEIRTLAPQAVLLSPGPCTPFEAGICMDVVRELGAEFPILGVCLGHQAIGAALGGTVQRAAEPVHGRTSLIEHIGTGLFTDCPVPLQVTRYHSLIVERETLPECLRVTAWTADGTIMALEHTSWPLYGVQFHPESVLTHQGHLLLRNFLSRAGIVTDRPLPAGDLERAPEPGDDFYGREIDLTRVRPLPWHQPVSPPSAS